MTITPITLPDDFGNEGPRDAAILREVFDYENGKLFWRLRAGSNAHIGRQAGHAGTTGYRRIVLSGKCLMAHKAIWLIHNDEWPEWEIDHINGKRDDNRIENLRSVSHKENMKNIRLLKSNKSGTPGVHWNNHAGKWQARIAVDGQWKSLGLFMSLDDAVQKRKQAQEAHGYHENHGRS